MTQVSDVNVTLDPSRIATAGKEQRRRMLKAAAGEVVATTFVGEMLKIARTSSIQGTLGHGGRGEKVFRAQLDQQFAELVGRRMKNDLTEAIYNSLAKRV
jgi:hypothetical protein